MAKATKDIIGGMDTGGGVGFGIPADWGGGVQDADPDPVIEEYNSLAEKRLGRFIAPPRKQVDIMPVLADAYSGLPEDSPVRKRAREFEEQFSAAHYAYEKATERLESQKNAAQRLESIANSIASNIRTKQQVWEGTVQKTNDSSAIESEYEKAIQAWRSSTEHALSKADDIKLWEVSPKFTQAFVSLASVDVKSTNPFGQDRKFDVAVQQFDEAVEQLHEVSKNGGGSILSAYREAERNYAEYTEGLKQMSKDITRAASVNPASKSQVLRLLETSKGATRNDDNAANVPNYRLALDTSPRVCGSCRFFEWTEGTDEGRCSAFDFTAKAKYTCDAWQAEALTSVHTAMRDEGRRSMMRRKDADTNWNEPTYESPVEYIDGTPEEDQGRVTGRQHVNQHTSDEEIVVVDEINYSVPEKPDDNAALRAANKNYLPGDVVYSRALRTLAVVQGAVNMAGNKVYSLKLIDNKGGAWGSGISFGDDLQPRSKTATKKARRRMKSDDIADMVEVTRSVYKALKQVVETHSDLMSMPLSNKDVLTPLQEDMLSVMENPMFDSITTGQKRKYYRALQKATHSIGAARQVLFEGYKTINVIRRQDASAKSQMRDIMLKAQQGAYDRVLQAFENIEDALTMPSATHGDPAPGVKKVIRRGTSRKDLYDGVFDIVASNVDYDNISPISEGLPFGTVEFEVSKTVKGGIKQAQADLNGMMSQVKNLENKSNLEVNIIEGNTTNKSFDGNSRHIASVTFTAKVLL